MKRFIFPVMCLVVFATVALASDSVMDFSTKSVTLPFTGVPPLTAGELTASPEASWIWLFLSGEGLWGSIFVAVFGIIYKVVRPILLDWLKSRRLDKLYLAAETCATAMRQKYVDGMKAANADGKLTKEEAEQVFNDCKNVLRQYMLTQGIDIIKEYGDEVVNVIIEYIVGQLKNPIARAVALPLDDSPPLPSSVMHGMKSE